MESKQPNQQELIFYDKKSNFTQLSTLKTCLVPSPVDYTLKITQNEVNQNELAIANSDFSIQLVDLNTFQIESFAKKCFHTDQINAIKFSNIHDNEQLQNVVFSASSDKCVKVWDRRNGEAVGDLKYNGKPFFSVDCDKNVVCGGSNSEVIFWDLRKMKFLMNYKNAHTDDVTCVRYHNENPNWLTTCSTDNLLCHFDFANKASFKEDDTMEGVYCSEQPLINCGFISNTHIWTQTSINTVEIITVENCDVFAKINKFPHQVDYVIDCVEDKFTKKFIIYCGNNQGEVFIYEFVDKDTLNLVDMILTKQETIVRNVLKASEDTVILTTEKGDLTAFKYTPQAQGQPNQLLMDLAMEDVTDGDQELKMGKQKGNKNNFKPY